MLRRALLLEPALLLHVSDLALYRVVRSVQVYGDLQDRFSAEMFLDVVQVGSRIGFALLVLEPGNSKLLLAKPV